jgi:hypothetical protein
MDTRLSRHTKARAGREVDQRRQAPGGGVEVDGLDGLDGPRAADTRRRLEELVVNPLPCLSRMLTMFTQSNMAEREGFEPSVR